MKYLLLFFFLQSTNLLAQYPFEKYPKPKYKVYKKWKYQEDTSRCISTLAIKKENWEIEMISYDEGDKISEIHVKQDGNETQCFKEDMFFSTLNVFKPVRVTDINGDGLQDIKIIVPYQGNGIAALYVKVIYLFQNIEGDFTKVSFTDMMGGHRSERDIDGMVNMRSSPWIYKIMKVIIIGYLTCLSIKTKDW